MKNFFVKKRVRKFLFRWMVINVVFFSVKLTMDHNELKGFFGATSLFYYASAFFLFMITWEINDYLLKRHIRKGRLDLKNSLKIVSVNLGIVIPLSAAIYYLGLFPLKETLGIICANPKTQFFSDFFRAVLLGFTVIFFNMFYYAMNYRDELEKKLENLQKEMITSQYASLKNQISPHFLFNSLNTLTSLMYEDRDLASDFVTRLASTYRYILDNRERDLVSLDKEISFLDAYIFMMEVRHKKAVKINVDLNSVPRTLMIPTLALQMLVENALKHNKYSKEQPLSIDIKTIGDEVLVVRNNLQKREIHLETTQMGLQNIKKRYAFYTNKQVLVREETDFFEVIIPLLDEAETKKNLKVIS